MPLGECCQVCQSSPSLFKQKTSSLPSSLLLTAMVAQGALEDRCAQDDQSPSGWVCQVCQSSPAALRENSSIRPSSLRPADSCVYGPPREVHLVQLSLPVCAIVQQM